MKFKNETKEPIKVRKEGTNPPEYVTVYPDSFKAEGQNLTYEIEVQNSDFASAYETDGLTLVKGKEKPEVIEGKAGEKKVETKTFKKGFFGKLKGKK